MYMYMFTSLFIKEIQLVVQKPVYNYTVGTPLQWANFATLCIYICCMRCVCEVCRATILFGIKFIDFRNSLIYLDILPSDLMSPFLSKQTNHLQDQALELYCWV